MLKMITLLSFLMLLSATFSDYTRQFYPLTSFQRNGQRYQPAADPYTGVFGRYTSINPSVQSPRWRFPPAGQYLAPQFLPPITRFPTKASLFAFGGFNFTQPAAPAEERPLFTPAVVQYPPESPGQLDNYRKALEEYAKEDEEALQELSGGSRSTPETDTQTPVTYVRVNLGGNGEYSYNV